MTPIEQDKKEQYRRLAEAINLQLIEDNPLTQEEIEMFEMFIQKDWSDEECRAYLTKKWDEKLAEQKLAAE